MLVLTRKRGERIIIAEEITITVVRIGDDSVRLGVDAPREVRVLRAELLPIDQNTRRRNDDMG